MKLLAVSMSFSMFKLLLYYTSKYLYFILADRISTEYSTECELISILEPLFEKEPDSLYVCWLLSELSEQSENRKTICNTNLLGHVYKQILSSKNSIILEFCLLIFSNVITEGNIIR